MISSALKERITRQMVDKLVGPEFPRAFQPFVEGTSSAYYRILESVLTNDPYAVRTIIAPGTQALASARGSRCVAAALEKLDFFVVADVTRTADMPWADIVLPLATSYEVDHPFQFVPGWLMATNRVIAPVHSSKSIFDCFFDLAVAMGYEKDFWGGSIPDAMDDQLESMGLTMDELRLRPTGEKIPPEPMAFEKYERVFNRASPRLSREPFLPNGKVEIYNEAFESDYHTSKNFSAAWQRNVPRLLEIQRYPALHIHPRTANSRDIADGDWVKVASVHGWIKVKAEIYPGIRPDTVMLLHGWWQGCRELGLEDTPLLDGFDYEKCTQCHGCEVACRSWRELGTGVRHRRVLNVWRGTYPDVKSHSVSMKKKNVIRKRSLS
jgi:anaerobic selenocysteine-containing dehydrogenase